MKYETSPASVLATAQHCAGCGVGWKTVDPEACWLCGGVGEPGGLVMPKYEVETYEGQSWSTEGGAA